MTSATVWRGRFLKWFQSQNAAVVLWARAGGPRSHWTAFLHKSRFERSSSSSLRDFDGGLLSAAATVLVRCICTRAASHCARPLWLYQAFRVVHSCAARGDDRACRLLGHVIPSRHQTRSTGNRAASTPCSTKASSWSSYFVADQLLMHSSYPTGFKQ